MVVGKPVSKLVVNEYRSTVDDLIERGWFEQTPNYVMVTEFGELVMMGALMHITSWELLPDMEGKMDLQHSKYLTEKMNEIGLVNTFSHEGEIYMGLADEGVQMMIKLADAAKRDGHWEDMLDLCQEEKVRGFNIVKLNEEGKKLKRS